jgi:glycosyltransferase involved in cell wall biosynthesis
MFNRQKVVVVMPAYNAERTLVKTYKEVVACGVVDQIIVVDDASSDDTLGLAEGLPRVKTFAHPRNRGYGGNQKTCYQLALKEGADIIVMIHPDYQYTPKLVPALVSLIGNGLYDCALGSRILGGQALKGGMPRWKYLANRMLTLFQNLLLGSKLSEFHTGYRAFSRELLLQLPIESNSDDFVFDSQMLAQVLWGGHTIGEVNCPTRYDPDSSTIGFRKCIRYGLGCVWTAITFRLAKMGFISSKVFPPHE